MADFLPRRIEQRQQALADFDGEIIKACHKFISKSAGPLIRDLLARAKAKVKAQIKDSFEDETDLEDAISKSKLVAEVERIQSFVKIQHAPQDSVIVYAAVLMKAWQDTEAVSAKLGLTPRRQFRCRPLPNGRPSPRLIRLWRWCATALALIMTWRSIKY